MSSFLSDFFHVVWRLCTNRDFSEGWGEEDFTGQHHHGNVLSEIMEANDITEEQIEELQDAFQLFDKDGDGTITTRELGSVMRSMGQNPTEKELQEMINQVDFDGNGTLDFPEFVKMMTKKSLQSNPFDESREAFRVFDIDNTGHVKCSEIMHVLKAIGVSDDEANEICGEADVNNDGYIEFEEFEQMIMPSK